MASPRRHCAATGFEDDRKVGLVLGADSNDVLDGTTGLGWYCIRSQVKREKIAAATLADGLQVEVFCPRVRSRKKTPRGLCWFDEAMFPGYFFARFDFERNFRDVSFSIGVSGIVHFGTHYAVVPDNVVELLREAVGEAGVRQDDAFSEGDRVLIAEGPFGGLLGVVTECSSGKERVKVLLDFLGRQVNAELDSNKIIKSD